MSPHPLIERAKDRRVRQSKGFKDVAAELKGDLLLVDYQQELARAPRRHDTGKRYFPKRAKAPRLTRPEDYLAAALVRFNQAGGVLALPNDGPIISLLDHRVALQSAQAVKDDASDSNRDIGRIDVLGLTAENRTLAISLKFLAPDATRGGTGDTPLRALLEGLAHCAIAQANQAALAEEIAERFDRELSDEPPILVLLGTARYWEICRRREPQKGAAWINQMERLADEVQTSLGVQVLYLTVDLEGDPLWTLDEEGWPKLTQLTRFITAWSELAGRVRPKPRPRAKSRLEAVDAVVAADLSRPVRDYAMNESYEPGDRVGHPNFGTGVVQGAVGARKIKVRFDETERVLVHKRPTPGL